jgi:probable rRNA maturation factor
LVKNLQVSSQDISISKKAVHKLIVLLKNEFQLEISSLSISFISSNKLREINEQFLNHNYNTDILTFNYSNKQKEIDGEILISFEEARSNAKKFNVNYGKELTRLVIHGVLHLLNFDDTDSLSKKIMKKEENKLINKFNFTLLAGK